MSVVYGMGRGMAVDYRQAGVDIEAADALVERIKPLARSTRTEGVIADVGGFAGLFRMPDGIEEPLLVSGTDGVGTKLKVAIESGQHGTVGQDLVAMCVNDVLTTGAAPLFFLDYFGCGRLDVAVAEAVISGIADGCKIAHCALLGGETAELPGMYPDGEYDLAGFAVGVVGRRHVLGPARVSAGDVLIAVASSGLHSNGYSLARRVLQHHLGLKLDEHVAELGRRLADELLVPTRIYAVAVQALREVGGDSLHALCHITGGGLPGNLPRVLPRGVTAKVVLQHRRPSVFDLIQRGGPVEEAEMRRTFNLGIGLVAVVEHGAAGAALAALARSGEVAWKLGTVVPVDSGSPPGVDFE